MEGKSMKKTNMRQFTLLVREIEKHPELSKRTPLFGPHRAQTDSKWEEVAMKLNDKGPPERTVQEWKKVFCDLRLRVTKKIVENEAARCTQHILSEMEANLGRVLQLVDTVRPKGETFGVPFVPGFSTVTVRTVDRDVLNETSPPPLGAVSQIKLSVSSPPHSPQGEQEPRISSSPSPPSKSSTSRRKRRSHTQSNYLFRQQLINQKKYMKISQDMGQVMYQQSLCLKKLTKAVERQEQLMEQQLALIEKQTLAIERQAVALERMAAL